MAVNLSPSTPPLSGEEKGAVGIVSKFLHNQLTTLPERIAVFAGRVDVDDDLDGSVADHRLTP